MKEKEATTRERRTIHRPIRWKASEIARTDELAAAAGVDWSEWVRAAALRRKPKPQKDVPGLVIELAEIMGGLNKVGGNINQIAKRLNMGNQVEESATIQAMQAVEQCAAAIRQHIEALTNDR